MTTFYLIRHGDIPHGPGDPGLSALGQTQAARAAAFLKDKAVQHIYASPLRRAVETASIIAASLVNPLDGGQLPVKIDPRLRERMNWGDLPHQSWEEFAAAWDQATKRRDVAPPGGISAHQAAANLSAFLTEKALQFPNDAIAAIAHSGIISDFLIDFIPPTDLARLNPAWPVHQDDVITHCSITTLIFDASGPHLAGLAESAES